jgi:hypothetical protein
MSALIVNGATPLGGMSNSMVENFFQLDQQISRLAGAVADAASGFTGTAGTEYETGSNFGVVPNATPGAQGTVFAYQINTIAPAWATFRAAVLAAMTQLDNG